MIRNARMMLRLLLATFAIFGICGCGPMVVKQVRYLAVPSGDNVNYYRITVKANTVLGESSFKAGWFPKDAVDSLFGDVSDPGKINALKIRQEIKTEIDKYYLKAAKAFLKAAADSSNTNEDLQKLLEAQKRVLAIPGELIQLPAGAIQMEYDPGRALALLHADDKLVFVLSSDPDEVFRAITNFAENQQTDVQVTRLAEVLGRQAANQVAAGEAEIAALQRTDRFLAARINQVLQVANQENPVKDDLLKEMEELLNLVEGFR